MIHFSLCDILQDGQQLMNLLTYHTVESTIKERVEAKGKIFGQDVNVNGEENCNPTYKIEPSLIADLYGDWIMPLTKEVQVGYLLRRLDWKLRISFLFTSVYSEDFLGFPRVKFPKFESFLLLFFTIIIPRVPQFQIKFSKNITDLGG